MSRQKMTIENVLETVWEQVQKLQSGDTTAKTANAISHGVSTIIRGIALEVKYAQITGREPNIKMLENSVSARRSKFKKEA